MSNEFRSKSGASKPNALRRQLLASSASLPLAGVIGYGSNVNAQGATKTLNISHQFPGGTIQAGDFRDRLCRKFAESVEKRTKGALKFQVYPGSSLMKTNAQFSALRKGALDISLFPLPYAGGEVPELNIGLMPALVTSYEQAAKWKTAEVGRLLTKALEDKGVVILSWVWQAGGVASRSKSVVLPEDVKGMKIRGGSREFDLMLKAAGASVISLPSNEIYAAMQTGAMDAAYTSSTSFLSFKLEELAKAFTSARNKSYWFMLEPLLMSKQIFDALPKDQRDALMAAGAEMEKFGLDAAKEDDKTAALAYARAGSKVTDVDTAIVDKWRVIARESAWKDYAEKNESCANLLKAAEKVV
jgi:TRAP-type C4-dicarboxylate transport system substrate-binding protein